MKHAALALVLLALSTASARAADNMEKKAAALFESWQEVKSLKDWSDENDRLKLVRRLGGLPSKTARRALLRIYRESRSLDDRLVALSSLCRILDPATFTEIVERISKKADPVTIEVFGRGLLHAPRDLHPWLAEHALVEIEGPALPVIVRAVGVIEIAAAEVALRGLYRRHSAKRTGVETAAEAVRALGRIGAPNWPDALLDAAVHEDDRIRRAAAMALAGVTEHDEKSLSALKGLLGDASPVVRRTAAEWIGKKKVTDLAPYVIELIEEKEIRSRRVARETLIRLSGLDRAYDREAWHTWWQQRERLTPAEPQALVSRMGYHGIPTETGRALILIEATGYMNWPWRSKPKRHVVAQRELRRLLGALPDDADFTMMAFGEKTKTWKKKPVRATEKNVASALEWLAKGVEREGKPDAYRALETAIGKYGDFDTIYLVGTGWRSFGEVNSPEAVLASAAVWLRDRDVEIHTIGLTLEALDYGRPNHYSENTRFLVDLAKVGGGRTVQFKNPP